MSHLRADHSASDLGRRQIESQNLAALSAFFLVFNLLVPVPAPQRLLDPILPSSKAQSVQEKREAAGGVDNEDEQDVQALEPGRSIKRGLAGRQQATYRIELSVTQFLRVIVEQVGIDVAESLYHLADIRRQRGDYGQAEQLYQRALAIWEKALGPKRPQVAVALKGLAVLYAAKGDLAQAGACESRANAVSEHDLALQLAVGSERQKLAYLALKANQVDQTISLRLRYAPQNPTARDLAATLILQSKGRALDATSENLNSPCNRFDPEDHALLDQLTSTRSQLARLVHAGPQRLTAEQERHPHRESAGWRWPGPTSGRRRIMGF